MEDKEIYNQEAVKRVLFKPYTFGAPPKQIGWTLTDRGCWNCTSHKTRGGYPIMSINSKCSLIHRHVYSKVVLGGAKIPDGLVVRHKCDNTVCINPAHLELGTVADNNRDKVIRGRIPYVSPEKKKHRLNKDDILAIRASSDRAGLLANQFGVCKDYITVIRNRKVWKNI